MLLNAGGSTGLHGLQCQALNNATVKPLILDSIPRRKDGGYLAWLKLVHLVVVGSIVQIGRVKYSTKINGIMDLLTQEQILPPPFALFN